VNGLALVDEGRVARDHEEPAQLGQGGDDVRTDAVGKIFLFPIAAHGNCGPVGQRQGRARLAFCRRRVGRLNVVELPGHPTDEAKALSRNCPDQFLVPAAVANGDSPGIDSAGKCRVRYGPALPHQGDEIILADDALAVLQQIDRQVEHLRLHGNRRPEVEQFAALGVERVIAEYELHVCSGRRVSRNDVSRNNQVRLRDKSSVGQSLSAEFQASLRRRDPFCRDPFYCPNGRRL